MVRVALSRDHNVCAATAEAQSRVAAHRRAFAQGIEVIDGDARLTERGQAIMAGARAHMALGAP